MHRFLQLSDRPEDTYVAGLSMGGYGAMRLALTYPERFAAAASFSGAVDIMGHLKNLPKERRQMWENVFGDPDLVAGTEVDNMYMMKKNAGAPNKPKLYISCGTKDFLYPTHLTVVPELKKNGWDVTAYEKPDAIHEWGFWDEQIKAFIDFIYKNREE